MSLFVLLFPCFVLHVLISVPFATVCAGLSLFVFVFPCLCWFVTVCVGFSLFVFACHCLCILVRPRWYCKSNFLN